LKKFICALRDEFSSGICSGCVATVGKRGIEVNHLFLSNLETIPSERIIKIIQFKNRRIDVKIEYNTSLNKKAVVWLRVLGRKAFIAYVMALGFEVETKDVFE